MNKAVFFDRDGVINNDYDNYYVYRPEEIIINPGIPELLAHLKKRGYLLVIISNQGGIAKGIYSKEDVERTNARILHLLSGYKIIPDEIYYCPHHPETGMCICRKPDTLMIEKAISRFDIDISESFIIGDRDTDIEAGSRAGLKTIKVDANQDMTPLIKLFN
jgi:D-glycero-D-manno-heptose 1,7-bisphosphate phosphatase